MSSKSDNTDGPTLHSATRRSSSITTRLAISYGCAMFSVLLIMTSFLYWILVTNLKNEDYEYLFDKVELLQKILQKRDANLRVLEPEVIWEGHKSQPSHYVTSFARIEDAQGNTIIETPGMSTLIPDSAFPTANYRVRDNSWQSEDGKHYLLMTTAVTALNDTEVRWRIYAALEVTKEYQLIQEYQKRIIFVLGLGIIISGIIGILITRHALRPLRKLTSVLEKITTDQLHQRVVPHRWPTELTTLAWSFDQMLDRLEDSFRRLSQFSADLAHEFRTPLNNLIGATEVTLSRPRSADEYRALLESSAEEDSRLSRLLESLLFLARVDGTHLQLNLQQIDVLHELEAVREFYYALSAERSIAVTCTGNTMLAADPILFRRAVSNLLANAIRHTPLHGEITLGVQQQDSRWVDVYVSDTGSGIPDQHLPKIFDRFYRIESSRSSEGGGIGLGLAIVQSIMRLHGGVAEIKSKLAKGTTVLLHFPPQPAANAANTDIADNDYA